MKISLTTPSMEGNVRKNDERIKNIKLKVAVTFWIIINPSLDIILAKNYLKRHWFLKYMYDQKQLYRRGSNVRIDFRKTILDHFPDTSQPFLNLCQIKAHKISYKMKKNNDLYDIFFLNINECLDILNFNHITITL